MKKTLITLLALTGVAMADDYKGTFSWGSGKALTLSFGDAPIEVVSISAVMTPQVTGSNPDTNGDKLADAAKDTPEVLPEASNAVYKATNYLPGTFTPDTNIGNGGTWTLSLTLKNASDVTMDITQIAVNLFTYNGDGDMQGKNTQRSLVLTLGGGF